MKSPRLIRRAAGTLAAAGSRVLSHRRVFRAAMLVNDFISRCSPLAPAELRRNYRFDGPREGRLFRMLEAMTRYGCLFDPIIRVDGEADLDAALADGKGVLLLGPHTMLTTVLLRHLCDRNLPPFILSGNANMLISGTSMRANAMRPSPTALLRVSRTLRANGVVCALVDRRPAKPGPLFDVAENLFHLAVRLHTHILFMATQIEGDGLVTNLEWATREPRTAQELIDHFVDFAHRQIAVTAPQFRVGSAPAHHGTADGSHSLS